jgi:hypothetical protein
MRTPSKGGAMTQLEVSAKMSAIGAYVQEASKLVYGRQYLRKEVIQGSGEHALVLFYEGVQVIIHILDDPALYGAGSRFRGWFYRKQPLHRAHLVVSQVTRWLENRAAKRKGSMRIAA